MLCCLIGALLAGEMFAAWRIARVATKSVAFSWVRRGALIGAIALAPIAVAVAAYASGEGARDQFMSGPDGQPCVAHAWASAD